MTIQQLKYKCTCEMNDDIEQIINDLSSSKPDAVQNAVQNAKKLLTELQQINPNIKKLQDALTAATTSTVATSQVISAATPATQVTAAGLSQEEKNALNEIQINSIITQPQKDKLELIANKLQDLQKNELNEIIKSTNPITQPQKKQLELIATTPVMKGGRRKKHKSRKNRKLKKYKSKKRR